MSSHTLRTWIEIDKKALRHNAEQFLRFIPVHTRLMAVIKSNAYGHGLMPVAETISALPAFRDRGWFGVDSLVEGVHLREKGIDSHILVLGYTLPARLTEAAEQGIKVSISSFEALAALAAAKKRPAFHLKIDTGMHRQGFLLADMPRLARSLKRYHLHPEGIFTHFAAAKDMLYPTYTREQLTRFHEAVAQTARAGSKGLIRHAAASGGALLFPESHLDMVRIGMALYGHWPSPESQLRNQAPGLTLKPVLTWKTVIGEIKKIPAGSSIGYDLTTRVSRPTQIAILPIGYWHGYDRGLSGIGEVLIRAHRASVLGRVSMDMIVADVTEVGGVRVGDEALLIGADRKERIAADELALKIDTSAYEVLTRINPLIERIIL